MLRRCETKGSNAKQRVEQAGFVRVERQPWAQNAINTTVQRCTGLFMPRIGSNNDNRNPGFFGRLFWACAWIAQICLWVFLLFIVAIYCFEEIPSVNGCYTAGLPQGFDGLAGVVASINPSWDEVKTIKGHAGGTRYSFLQGETVFNVWLDMDIPPSWNSGLASLKFDQDGKLYWVRRYAAPERMPAYAADAKTGESFPVVYALPVPSDTGSNTGNK